MTTTDRPPESHRSLRICLLDGLDWPRLMLAFTVSRQLESVAVLLQYGSQHPARSRRTPVDIPALVAEWCDCIAGLATSHLPSEHTRSDFRTDDLLMPLLACPVKQLREFAGALASALEKDERIPYLVWRPFAEYLRNALANKAVDEVIELKSALAREIAEAVEKDVQPQLVDAITGALRWRAPETLQKVKTAVKAGASAKLTGKQSCLFLECAGELVML